MGTRGRIGITVIAAALCPALADGAEPADPVPSSFVETMLARPLFSPSRRPDSVAAPERSNQSVPLPRLAGIIVTSTRRRAMFAADPPRQPTVVAEGDTVAGYVVERIAPAEVTLRDGATVIALRPRKADLPAPQSPQGLDVINSVLFNPYAP